MPLPPLLLKILLLIFLFSSMLGAGLALTGPALLAPLRDRWLVLSSLAVSFLAAPAAALLVIHTIPLQPGHATGLILLSGAAGAPFLPKLVELAQGDLPASVALMALLTAGTILFLPLALPWLAPGLQASPWTIARPLLAVILLPLAIGMLLRHRFPNLAARGQLPLGRLASYSGLVMLVLMLARDLPSVRATLGSGAIASMVLFITFLFVLGYLTGGATPHQRAVAGLASGSRNAGVALVPAAQPGVDPAVMTMVVTGTLVMILVLLGAIPWLRYTARSQRTSHDLA